MKVWSLVSCITLLGNEKAVPRVTSMGEKRQLSSLDLFLSSPLKDTGCELSYMK